MKIKNNSLNDKKHTHIKVILLAAMLFAVIYIIAGLYESCFISVKKYEIYSDKVSSAVRIVNLSDIHDSTSEGRKERILSAVENLVPDIVTYSGDISHYGVVSDGTYDLMADLADIYPSFFVTGNHEYIGTEGNENKITKRIKSFGVCVLDGETEIVKIGSDSICVCGVPDIVSKKEILSLLLADASKKAETKYFTLLLSHRPELIWLYSRYCFDLVLCGHAHGGQWRFPPFINGIYAPDQGIFPHYTGGTIYNYEYRGRTTEMIVSRGLSDGKRMFRFYNPPEIVCIDILPKR
ncbi:MAG: metallophosphoesterase [Oscillospiraceae bacterium]|nr:metallophosphoesterase [Oscillospiraceae bacterium]